MAMPEILQPAWEARQSNTDEAEALRRNNGLDNDSTRLSYAIGWLRAMRDDCDDDFSWRRQISLLLEMIDDGRGGK